MCEGSYILRAINRFRIFGIGNVQSRADKFDSLLQGALDSGSAKYVLWSNFVLV